MTQIWLCEMGLVDQIPYGKSPSAASKGEEAARELVKALENDGCVDEWLQDQVIIFMALADGESALNVGKDDLTLHTRSAVT